MAGAIDIVCNLFTPEVVDAGQTGLDDEFKAQIRMPAEMRGGVPIETYLEKMDRAGIERSLLIAVRAGDINIKGGFEIPYETVYDICQKYPDRFSGLGGVDPFRGMQGLRELESAVKEYGFVGAHLYPHWCGLPPDHAKYYPFYAKCCELDVPIQMQVGQSMVYSKEYRTRSVGQPITLDTVACDLPELKLIGIHIGIPWHDEMISMAWKHENVYIGSDAHRPKYWPQSFTHYLNSYGQDKVIFGTDFPVLEFKQSIDDIDGLDLKPEVRRKLLRDNVIRIYGLDID